MKKVGMKEKNKGHCLRIRGAVKLLIGKLKREKDLKYEKHNRRYKSDN